MAANMQSPPPADTIRRLKQSFTVMQQFVTNRTTDGDAYILACETFDTEFASAERLGFTPSDIFASIAYWAQEKAS
jgi:hypothetical protein